MPIIQKPMLAGNFNQNKAKFPYIATPKIDGIRFLMVNGVAVSRTFKPIRNKYIQQKLQETFPDGVDGELTSGNTFQESTSAIMSIEGEPKFKAWIFDYVDPSIDDILPYYLRILHLTMVKHEEFEIQYLTGTNVHNMQELARLEKSYLELGYEGVMLRSPHGTYKFGRSTVNENILLKLKRFEDDEAVLVDVLEKMSNQNEAETDAFGYVKRSASLDGMIPCNTTGTLIVENEKGRFGIGSGLDDATRSEIWNNKESYLGKIVKYKYFSQGVKDLPRHPVFLGFRDPLDMGQFSNCLLQ